jgi:hypothetical protein
MAKVEIVGLNELKYALAKGLPSDMTPYVLREISRKPAQSASKVARDLMPIGETGATGRTIGVRKVNNQKQTFVEVGFRGRSLGHIYISADTISRRGRGTVKGFPWLFRRTGEAVKVSGKTELRKDIGVLIARSLKKRGYG